MTAAATVRVLINAIHAHSGGGVTYLRHLLPELAKDPELDLHLCCHAGQRAHLPLPETGVTVHAERFAEGFLGRLVWEQLSLPGLARRIGAQVVFSPANFGPLFGPPAVILLRNALAVGENEKRFAKRVYWWALGVMTRLSIRRARGTIAVSAYARDALTAGLPGRLREATAVVPHGVAPRFAPPVDGAQREDFLLCVGDIYIQKNLHGMLRALALLRGDYPDLRLKVAGRPVDADYATAMRREAADHGVADAVEWLGPVAPDDLVDLYRRCRLFVFPSLVETFGNPLVEAMACGAPVVASNTAAMPEVAGEAAVYFDPHDPPAMATAIGGVLSDPARLADLSERSGERAAAFSWETTAARTAAVLKAAAGS